MPDFDDELAALRAADPAQNIADPDAAAIRKKVRSVTPVWRSRLTRPVVVAAAVALVVGASGGVGVATALGGQRDADATNEVAIAPVAGAPQDSQAMTGGSGQAKGFAGTSAVNDYLGRPLFTAGPKLSSESGQGASYQLRADTGNRKSQLREVADAFDISGKVTGNETEGYSVGDVKTNRKPWANIGSEQWDTTGNWYYQDPRVQINGCPGDVIPLDGSVGGSSAGSSSSVATETSTADPGLSPEPVPSATAVEPPAPLPSGCEVPEGKLPTSDEAIAIAQDKFAQLGLAADAANWSASEQPLYWIQERSATVPPVSMLVTAELLVDGLRTGLSWTMTIGAQGAIASANGFFAQVEKSVTYEIVSAREAAARSRDAKWINLGPQQVWNPGTVYPQVAYSVSAIPAPQVSKDAQGHVILDAGVTEVPVDSAEPALYQWWLVDGSTVLLPAYRFDAKVNGVDYAWLQIAVADKYVDFN